MTRNMPGLLYVAAMVAVIVSVEGISEVAKVEELQAPYQIYLCQSKRQRSLCAYIITIRVVSSMPIISLLG